MALLAAMAQTCLLADSAAVLKGVQLFRQSSVVIRQDKQVIYFDPYQLYSLNQDADFIFISHTHGDHLSIPDIKGALKPGGVLIVTEDAVEQVKSAGITNVVTAAPGKEYTVAGLKFKAVPAYNIDKGFHPQANKWVGYIVYPKNGFSYYFAGDTDFIPEMKDFKADVAFLPVGGTYTMTAEEAAKAANLIKPAVAVPMHYLDVVGTLADAKKFISLLNKGIKGVDIKVTE